MGNCCSRALFKDISSFCSHSTLTAVITSPSWSLGCCFPFVTCNLNEGHCSVLANTDYCQQVLYCWNAPCDPHWRQWGCRQRACWKHSWLNGETDLAYQDQLRLKMESPLYVEGAGEKRVSGIKYILNQRIWGSESTGPAEFLCVYSCAKQISLLPSV